MKSPPFIRLIRLHHALAAPWLLCGTWQADADTAFDAPGNFNPIVPGYFADPTIKKFGDTFYLYATTDGNGGGRGPATVWVSSNFVDWVLVPMNWPTTPHYWAPDVVKRPDGRYYLFYNQPCNTFAGASDMPIGPWTPLTPGDGLVIEDRLVKDVITLDTQFFEDKDGTLYGHWGTWGIFPNSGCGWGVFNADMKSFARLGMIPNTQAKDFFEAPFMIERNGVYYFTYSSGSCHDASYRVQYAVSDKPDGEFKMGPNNPILATSADGKVHGPGHHSILQQGDEYFIVYHRHDIPVTPNGMHRQICADRLVFERDGVIKKIESTHQGIGALGPKSPRLNLALTKKVTASSCYQDTLRHHEYRPEYAVDDNNATLWRPGNNRAGNWLTVDLGSAQRVRRTTTQFEYGTWFYQYLIESSLDGRTWKTFADRRQNTRWGSPMVDDGDAEARYLRLTVTGTELPGLFGAVWNFKAYTDAPADPLLAMADKAFAEFIASKPPSSRGNEAQTSSAQSQSLLTSAATQPLIHLDVAGLQLGTPITAWTNQGTLGGDFRGRETKPVVDMAGGRKAVRFSGKQMLTASFRAPRSLAGNSSFTVAAWVNNPEIGESECLISWAGRGGPDATTAQFGYGTHPEFGAVGHWGFADMGFRGAPAEAGQWHHLAVVFDGVIERVYVDGQLNNSEAKMLLMHEGRPVYVGASEPGSEYFDGSLAALRVYDGALSESEVKNLAADEPSADVLVHVDSAKLDYGPLQSWANNGSLGGAFIGEKAPVVADVNSRIAPRFASSQSLELAAESAVTLGDFTLLAGIINPSLEEPESAVEFIDGEAKHHALLPTPPAGGWHQLALVYSGGRGAFFINGGPTRTSLPPPPKTLKAVRLGGQPPFSGAFTRVQLFRRALSAEEVSQLHALWKQEWRTPAPNPAAFAQKPAALWPTAVAMTAERGRSDLGSVEYLFTETTRHAGASSSGWTPNAFFLDDGLQPNTRYAYTVAMRDPLGNVTVASAPLEGVTDTAQFQALADSFKTDRDYLAQGAEGTIWDGSLSQDDASMPEVIAAKDSVLRLQSKGTVWDGGKPLGAFLYKRVPGDFVAEATVADYAGLSTRKVPGNNDGGLMVRVPKVADAGPGEDLVQLNFFPIWNQGNMVTSLDGGRSQKGNMLAWDAHRHLQIIRQGTLFHFRTSADGEDWQDMPGSPVERKDLAGLPLQVGLYHASYGGDSSFVAFSNFRLIIRK
ncbi:MAG TPA: family 43 glycosylhydrolase [Candidatus Paceibacterota bacterium]|nr:family 43 glycosylhydrolase [Candidatus Paceibacterota bacterium]